MNARKAIGQKGEDIAARFMEGLGFRIEERNYRCSIGEIDLIASSEDYLIFVEVKARTAGQPFHPSDSVTRKKQAKVRQVGEQYLARHPRITQQPRFDVISVELAGEEEEEERVEHIPNAF